MASNLVCHALRLKPGEEITSSLTNYAESKGLGAVFTLTCVGSVTEVTLRMADSKTVNIFKMEYI